MSKHIFSSLAIPTRNVCGRGCEAKMPAYYFFVKAETANFLPGNGKRDGSISGVFHSIIDIPYTNIKVA